MVVRNNCTKVVDSQTLIKRMEPKVILCHAWSEKKHYSRHTFRPTVLYDKNWRLPCAYAPLARADQERLPSRNISALFLGMGVLVAPWHESFLSLNLDMHT